MEPGNAVQADGWRGYMSLEKDTGISDLDSGLVRVHPCGREREQWCGFVNAI